MKLRLMVWMAAVSTATAREHKEAWYSDQVAKAMNGRREVTVPDGRVDVLTRTHAIEVEFANHWKNAIGQALWYAMQTNKRAGVVIVLEDERRDVADAIRLESVIQAQKLPIRVWWWPRDFTPP